MKVNETIIFRLSNGHCRRHADRDITRLVDNPEIWIEQLNQIGIPNVTYTLIPKEDKGLTRLSG